MVEGMSLLEFVPVPGQAGDLMRGGHLEAAAFEVIAVRVPTGSAATVRTVLTSLGNELDERVAMEAVVEQLTPRRPASRGALLQARRNAVARDELAAEFGLYSSSEIAELAGSRAKNAAATAARWRDAGRIFAVTMAGTALFPGFQFAAGQPVSVIARVIDVLGRRLEPWALALWFTGDNSWLGGARPVDSLTTDADEVVRAAGELAAQLS